MVGLGDGDLELASLPDLEAVVWSARGGAAYLTTEILNCPNFLLGGLCATKIGHSKDKVALFISKIQISGFLEFSLRPRAICKFRSSLFDNPAQFHKHGQKEPQFWPLHSPGPSYKQQPDMVLF